MPNWMIYGANGYTGRLIAEEAARRGMSPILAGRGDAALELAQSLRLEGRKFDLRSVDEAAAGLKGTSFVLHCAGPFSATSKPLLDACIKAQSHYLDITGEIAVFESIFARSSELREAGIAAIPGVGFDVVPTDTAAALLKERLPDATKLKLAWKAQGTFSPGTAKSMIEGMAEGAMVRKDGKIVRLPVGAKSLKIDFNKGPESAVLIPWGDVSTAFYTTGIPDIEVYTAGSAAMAPLARIAGRVAGNPMAQRWLKAAAGNFIKGPSERARNTAKNFIWGEVRNAAGKSATIKMTTPEGYFFTIHSSLAVAERMLVTPPAPGALTPVLAFGTALVRQVPGVEL